jgi:hypothetical protein
MMTLIGFIDYYPGDSGFIIPIFHKDNRSFIQKCVKGTILNVDYNVNNEIYDSTNEQQNKTTMNKDEFFKMQDKILVEESKIYYAFKFNRDLISIGSKEEISKSIIYGLGTMKNNLGLHDELRRFFNDNNIDISSLKLTIDSMYKNHNNLAFEYAKYLFYTYNNKLTLFDINEPASQNQYYVLNQCIIIKLDPVFLMLRNEVNPNFNDTSNEIASKYVDLIINHSNISKDDPIYMFASKNMINLNQIKDYFHYKKIKDSIPKLYQHGLDKRIPKSKGYYKARAQMQNSYSSSKFYYDRIKQFFDEDKSLS